MEIDFGYTKSPSSWIEPKIKIEDDIIYVKGSYSPDGLPLTISVKVPDPDKKYRVFWIDEDGTKTEIQMH